MKGATRTATVRMTKPAQEIRARRELERLRADQDDEAERHAAQTRQRETERQSQLEQARADDCGKSG